MRNRSVIVVLSIIVAVLVIALAVAIVYIMNLRSQNAKGNKNTPIVISSNNTVNNIDNGEGNTIEDNAREVEKASFNAIFENYVGNNISPAQVKTLFDRIESNNEQGTHKVDLDTSGIIDSSEVDSSKTYNAEIIYDDEGYVASIKITESTDGPVTDPESDIQKVLFNSQFTIYDGDITGIEVNNMVQDILSSNGTNPNHQVNVTSSRGTIQSFDQINETGIYTTVISYDDDGWVNLIDINTK